MTCTLEQLKPTGLYFHDEAEWTGRAINKILRERLCVLHGPSTDALPSLFSTTKSDGDRYFVLSTRPAEIPPLKTAKVTESMIDDLVREWRAGKGTDLCFIVPQTKTI